MNSGDRLPAMGFEQAPYRLGGPIASATFKQEWSDFIVSEVLGFEPSGAGEHLFLLIQTANQNTRYTAKCIASQLRIKNRLVSFSGMKDRHGVTEQWFSVHLPGQNFWVDKGFLAEQGITVLRQERHHRKLRLGTHKANLFQIRLRQVAGDHAAIEQRICSLESNGVPNYFGPQRFGRDANNLRELVQWASQQALPGDRELRSILLSTLRAWVFNGNLGRRLQAGTWPLWQPKDIVMLAGTHSFFQPDTWDSDLTARLQSADIQVGDWLPGKDEKNLEPNLSGLLTIAEMKPMPRAIRLMPTALAMQWQKDDLVLRFELPTGTYATAVLRECFILNNKFNESYSPISQP